MTLPAPTIIGPYTSGEIPPPLLLTFEDSTGAAIDLSNGFVARWVYRRHTGAGSLSFTTSDPAVVIQTAAVAGNQTTNKGQVTYAWVSTDLATAGDYEGEMWVGNGTNRYASVRYAWSVRQAVSTPSI